MRAGKVLGRGDRFTSIFDYGDSWVHECRAAGIKVNPYEWVGREP